MARRSFAARLAELERLEAEREQERQAEDDTGLPALATLSDAAVVAETILGLRYWRLQLAPGQPAPPLRLATYPLRNPYMERWYAALAERAQPLIDALPQPFIPLARWEAEDAIAAIDAGHIAVTWITGNVGLRSCFRLVRAPGAPDDVELDATIRAVNHAVRLWAIQMGYPQVGAWELRELGDWRAWLIEQGAPLEYDDA